MDKKTLAETVMDVLDAADREVHREFFRHYIHDKDILEKFKAEGITFKCVDHYGGEGQGEEFWSVYSFTRDSEIVYVNFNGSYTSYDGSEFDEYYLSKAVPKTGFDYVKA